MKVAGSRSDTLQPTSAPAAESPSSAPRAEKPRPKPRDSSVREYHHDALNRADKMAAPPQQPTQEQQQEQRQAQADAEKTMRDTLAELSKSFLERWKIQHEGATAAGTTCLGQMRANSDSLGKAMQAWAQMMYGGGG